jgi:IS30 family transposase
MERQRIATFRERGLGVREIARRIGRAASTVSRELRRNMRRHDCNRYDADLAHARARERTRRIRRTRLDQDSELREVVVRQLELEWSPEQIAAHLRRAYPHRRSWHLCHETIYQALYRGGKGGLNRTLTRRLRTGRALRRRRRRANQRAVRFLAPSLLIDQRPPEVEARLRVGDWEGDLIVGRLGQSAIGTLVDRRSRYLRLVCLPDGHNAEQHRVAMELVLASLPAASLLTLTWDQGREMAYHDQLASYFREGIYFAHPASPWMRGTNENTNGLLRQYFPKRTDLRSYSINDLTDAEQRLNNRPRKVLGWQTPAQVFQAAMTH